MSLPATNHPAGTAGTCTDSMLLPPQAEGRRLRCQLLKGHPGHHQAHDGLIQRTWPRLGGPAVNQPARAAAGANVTPIKRGNR